ncbi:MAG: alanine racemase [Firmicutes bacterium]|nr:alanine racemase [Bacillota bacterium]
MYRNTWAEINLENIAFNIKTLIQKNTEYNYFFGVVKGNCYGHYDVYKTIIDSGCNYLAVATLDEALKIREVFKEIPILCLGIIPTNYFKICLLNNITITISNYEQIKNITSKELNNLKVHLKINTGMNRLGTNKKEIALIKEKIKECEFILEGIYSHIYNPLNESDTLKQIQKFVNIIEEFNFEDVPIRHLFASESLILYKKISILNGCRLGSAMYGFSPDKELCLKSTFKVISEVIQINEVKNETVGYNGTYRVNDIEKIAVVAIGYADGIIRQNTGRFVYINQKPYKIVGNICMDMLFVKVDDEVKINDLVEVIKDNDHIELIANHLNSNNNEVMCLISNRVPRKYLKS